MQRVVHLAVHGDLGTLSEEWTGWKLHRGVLWSPEGESFTVGQIRAGAYHRALARELQNTMRPSQLVLI